jgi:N4-(beta-N-acetylglucosaminyl)-L-asparaginase
MPSRRHFLQQTLLGGAAIAASGHITLDAPAIIIKKGVMPGIIATWDNRKATAAGWEILSRGGRALDAVEAGARVPEADPNDTSVGYGGLPDRDGNVTLDACIMDEQGNCGSVCYLQHIMHPISVARQVMEKTPHVMLVGEGALQFALAQGFTKENLLTEKSRRAWEEWKKTSLYKPVINSERHDTIGLVALDGKGLMSGACTTSGLAYKMQGRVGDSPVIGAGMYADSEVGGAAATGMGELMLRTLSSFYVVEEMRRGAHPQKAAELAVKRIVRKYPEQSKEWQAGFIAMDKRGRYGAFSIQKGFNYAIYQKGENLLIEAGHLI